VRTARKLYGKNRSKEGQKKKFVALGQGKAWADGEELFTIWEIHIYPEGIFSPPPCMLSD